MIITCEACGTSFRLKSSLLKETGSTVRCSKCHHLFIAYPTPPEPEKPSEFISDEKLESSIDRAFDVEAEEAGAEADMKFVEGLTELEAEIDEQVSELSRDTSKGLFEESETMFEDRGAGAQEPEIMIDDLEEDESEIINLKDLASGSEIAATVDLDELSKEPFEEEAGEMISLADIEQEEAKTEEITLGDLEGEVEEAPEPEDLEGFVSEAEIDKQIPEGVEEEVIDFSDMETGFEAEKETTEAEAEGVEFETEGGVVTELDDFESEKKPEDKGPPEKAEKEEAAFEKDIESMLDEEFSEKEAVLKEEIGLDLDGFVEMDLTEEPEQAPSEELEETELDLGPETVEAGDGKTEEELDLELKTEDFELDLEETDEARATEEALDLDFEDEDLELKTEDFELDLAGETTEALDEDFELDLEETGETPATEEALDLDFEAEDLELKTEDFELDLAGETAEAEEDFELDLDIEPETEEIETEDFELDLEEDTGELTTTESTETVEVETDKVKTEEFDLSEIEDFLDLEEPTDTRTVEVEAEAEEEAEEETLDFDLDFETVTAPEEDLDLETMLEEEETATEKGEEKEVALETFGEREKRIEAEYKTAEEPEGEAPAAVETAEPRVAVPEFPVRMEEEKSRAKPLLVALIVLATLLVLIFAIKHFGAKKEAPVSDLGNLRIEMVANPAYKFVENEKAGELLVVTGDVTNRYDHPRSGIQVKGTLYNHAGKAIGGAVAYCGNMFTDSDLSSLELETITKHLSNRKGDKNANLGLAPGQKVPFTVVFSSVPKDAEEFDIAVVRSSRK